MKEVKVNDKQNAIIGIDQKDITGITISIVINGIVRCEYPISVIDNVHGLSFAPDSFIFYDKTKDKIEVVVRVDGFERRRREL